MKALCVWEKLAQLSNRSCRSRSWPAIQKLQFQICHPFQRDDDGTLLTKIKFDWVWKHNRGETREFTGQFGRVNHSDLGVLKRSSVEFDELDVAAQVSQDW